VLLATVFGPATRVAAQAADTSYFVRTDHGDTIGIEQEVIAGNTLSGEWIWHCGWRKKGSATSPA